MKILHMLNEQNYFLFEFFLFFKLSAMFMSNIAINMLFQDKVCLVDYGQDVYFCQNIQDMNATETMEHTRDQILGVTTRLVGYKWVK